MTDHPETTHELITGDGEVLVATLHGATEHLVGQRPVVFLPALGTPARAYTDAARRLAAQGRPCLCVDLRGTGRSGPPPRRGRDWGFDEHLRRDLPAVRDWLRERRAGEPVWAGHSYGGHLAAAHVAAHPRGDAALILLASSDIGFRHWGTSALGILGTTQLCAALAALLGYFPGHKLGMGRPIARTVIFDWARWARTGRFRGSDGTDYGRLLSAASARVLSISFTDDQRMARRSAVDALARRFGNAEVTRWHLTPEEVGRAKVGHFGFLEEAEGFWRRIGEWVDGLEPVRRQELGSGAGDRLGEQP